MVSGEVLANTLYKKLRTDTKLYSLGYSFFIFSDVMR